MNYAERGYKPVTIILPLHYVRIIRLGAVFTLHLSTNRDYQFIEYLLETYMSTVNAIPNPIDNISPYCSKIKKKIIIKKEYIDTICERFGVRALNRTIIYFVQLYLHDNPDLEDRFQRAIH